MSNTTLNKAQAKHILEAIKSYQAHLEGTGAPVHSTATLQLLKRSKEYNGQNLKELYTEYIQALQVVSTFKSSQYISAKDLCNELLTSAPSFMNYLCYLYSYIEARYQVKDGQPVLNDTLRGLILNLQYFIQDKDGKYKRVRFTPQSTSKYIQAVLSCYIKVDTVYNSKKKGERHLNEKKPARIQAFINAIVLLLTTLPKEKETKKEKDNWAFDTNF